MFRPGDAAQGFVVVLEGRVEVFLTGPTGREILLYAVEPGQGCVQTTLGLMGRRGLHRRSDRRDRCHRRRDPERRCSCG
ncbi:MAG: cyclic nucleotide-binding domain-containing protein [Rhodopseudomonas palustris]|nr:cyclic nucleotide-binding domain-containing protein [Rhodopseudomonas palustris]